MQKAISILLFSLCFNSVANAQIVFVDYSRLVNCAEQILPNTQSKGLEIGLKYHKIIFSGYVSSGSCDEFKDKLDTLNYVFSANIFTFGFIVCRKIELNDFFKGQIGGGIQRQIDHVYYSGNFIGSSDVNSWDALINSGFEFNIIDELKVRLLATYSYRFSFTELSYRETTLNHRRSNLMVGVGIGYNF